MPIVGIPALVAASYNTSAEQVIPHGEHTVLDFETKLYDTHNAVTTGAAWKFTVLVEGLYLVSGSLMFAITQTWGYGNAATLNVRVDEVITAALCRKDNYPSGIGVYMNLNGSVHLYLSTGDNVDFSIWQGSGGALPLYAGGANNWIAIAKIG